MHIILISPVDR